MTEPEHLTVTDRLMDLPPNTAMVVMVTTCSILGVLIALVVAAMFEGPGWIAWPLRIAFALSLVVPLRITWRFWTGRELRESRDD